MSAESGKLLAGLDVGGTKSRLRIETMHGEEVLDRTYTNTGWATMTDEARAHSLHALLEQEVPDHASVAVLVAGVHGNDSQQQHDLLVAPLLDRFTQVEMLNDSHLVVMAHGLGSGVGVVAGTGSSATAILSGGGAITVGGWGWVLGDEGGAVGLVRDAARLILDAHDRQESDVLSDLLMDALGVDHPHALSLHLGAAEPRLWAQAAPVVFKALRAGSPRAARVVSAHAEALAIMVEQLRDRGGDVSVVVCSGGVFQNQAVLFDAFAAAVERRLGATSTVAMLQCAPVQGAINRARTLVGAVSRTLTEGALS